MRLVIITAVTFITLGGNLAQADVLGFRAWKNQRIEDARASFERVKTESSGDRQIPSQSPVQVRTGITVGRVQRAGTSDRLKQARTDLEIATEFSINDYFVLYLSQQDGVDAINQAAKKMSPDEVAELMIAYKKRLESGRSEIGLAPVPTSTPSRL
jgi:hypothetical protein